MTTTRKQKLQRNLKLSFWIQALTEIRVINVVSTLFLVHRGLTLAQVLYTAVVFSIVCLITEIPSSEPARIGGKRKMLPFRWGSVILLQVLRKSYHWR